MQHIGNLATPAACNNQSQKTKRLETDKKIYRNNEGKGETLEMPWKILNILKTNETNKKHNRKSNKMNHLISNIIHLANIPNLCNIFYRVSAHT